MLRHLLITDYALIDSLELELYEGLNLLSGETGSGKSIIVDALGLLLGSKASPEMVRTGCDRASVTGVFQGLEDQGLQILLEGQGLEPLENELIVKREVFKEGKSRAFINQQPITASVLKALGQRLVDIHGQNEQHALTETEAQLQMLDEFAGNKPYREALSLLSGQIASVRSKRESLEQNEKDRIHLIDLLSFQKKEIESVHLKPQEDLALNAEHKLLANSTRLFEAANEVYGSLYEAESSALNTIAATERTLETITRIDEKLQMNLEQLRSARILLEDVALSMRDYVKRIDISPARLGQLESRIAEIEKLRRKYGSTVDEILNFYDQVCHQLRSFENRDEELELLAHQLDALSSAYDQKAQALSEKRKKEARELERALEKELGELAMEKTRFKVAFTPAETDFAPTGQDAVEFMVAPNVGEELKPLAKIASGGELSRLMLALKTITHADSGTKTLVFDEVDAGIGGRTAEVLGRKLKALSRKNQILCVTHLPQIASFARHHYCIEKIEAHGRTLTRVEHLEEEARINELARMLSGAKITDAVRKHARELLKQGKT